MRKVGVWTLLVAGVLNGVGRLPQSPGTALLRDLIEPGAYLIFAGAVSAATFDRKDLVLLVFVITLIGAYPFDVSALARLLIPLGIGILIGMLLRPLLQQEQGGRHERSAR